MNDVKHNSMIDKDESFLLSNVFKDFFETDMFVFVDYSSNKVHKHIRTIGKSPDDICSTAGIINDGAGTDTPVPPLRVVDNNAAYPTDSIENMTEPDFALQNDTVDIYGKGK